MNHEEKIRLLQSELEKAKKEKERFDGLTPPQKIAETIHQYDCGLDHKNQCTWEYESWESPGTKRQYYHKKGLKIVDFVNDKMSVNDILKIIELIYT